MKVSTILIVIGACLIVAGILWHFGINLGKLPGDIVVQKKNFSFYFPITTMIIVSVVLMIVFYLIKYFRK